jgi:hypothetical protein
MYFCGLKSLSALEMVKNGKHSCVETFFVVQRKLVSSKATTYFWVCSTICLRVARHAKDQEPNLSESEDHPFWKGEHHNENIALQFINRLMLIISHSVDCTIGSSISRRARYYGFGHIQYVYEWYKVSSSSWT